MKNAHSWGRMLLWTHLFVCFVWLAFFREVFGAPHVLPDWGFHIVALSVLGVQFTWGFTVGLLVGPARKRRSLLWWSLLTVFFPLWFYGWIVFIVGMSSGLLLAMIYLSFFTIMLACETFCGVLLGVKTHSAEE